MKKTILFSAFALFFALAPHVFAEGFVPLAPIPGLTKDVVADSAGLASFFNNLYKYLIGLAAVLAVIQITWAGLEIAVNKEDVSKITDSKGKIYNAVFGLILVLSPVLVFSIINPAILNLSLNLPALDTRQGGTPIKAALPTCNAVRTKDCTPAAPTQEGTAATPTPGLYCYGRTSGTGTTAVSDYGCAATYDLCNKDYQLQSGGYVKGIVTTSSCILTPK